MDITEVDLQGGTNREPVSKEFEVPTLSVSMRYVASYTGVCVVGPLELATIVASSDISLEIALEHLDMLSEVHRQLVRAKLEIELVPLAIQARKIRPIIVAHQPERLLCTEEEEQKLQT